MNILSFLSFSLLILHYGRSVADIISARAFLGCAQVLTSRIHCYGGRTGGYTATGSFVNPTGDHFYIDLANFDFNKVSTASNNWTTVTGSNGGQYLTANSYQLATSILNKSKFVIYGGYGPSPDGGTTFLNNPMLMYDPPSNTWSALPLYGQYTILGAITDISSKQTLWTYGGLINNTNYYAQNQLFTFNYGTTQWTIQNGDPSTQNIKLSYTATLGNNNRIYMIGGFNALGLSTNTVANASSMLQVRWYDTTYNQWGVDTATVSNNQAISTRAYHTTTQIPGSNLFLVYGGSTFVNNHNDVHADFAYLYDYTKSQYTPLNLNVSAGAGRRSGHAAIAYNTDIFIMFGFDENFVLQNDINVLDVSNPTQPVWRVDTPDSSSSGASPTSTGTENATNTPSTSPVLSSGAIAGIAVGGAIVLVAIGVVAFLVIRKRNKRSEFEQDDPRFQYMPPAEGDILPTHFPSEATSTTKGDLMSHADVHSVGKPQQTSLLESDSNKPYSDE